MRMLDYVSKLVQCYQLYSAVIITLDYTLYVHGRIVRLITYFMYTVVYVGKKMESIQEDMFGWTMEDGWWVIRLPGRLKCRNCNLVIAQATRHSGRKT